MQFILIILVVFQFEMSGKYTNDEHPSNKHVIPFNFDVFHFDISFGKEINEEHSLNK